MRRHIYFFTAISLWAAAATAQETFTLDSCRAMALANNKELKVADIKIEQAGYQRQEAAAAYLPQIDFEGAYTYNQKRLALVDKDQLLPVKYFNPLTQNYEYELLTDPTSGAPVMVDGHPVPLQMALLPKDALTYNVHNVFAGALTITQPVYMGGKIKAMNEITRYAEELAHTMRDSKAEEVVYSVDAAYWQVVSLKAKQRLAESYVKLVESLDNDVKAMLKQGVVTRATLLTVDVKLNEAQVDLTRVNNGVVLSHMLLAQLCGMPVNTEFTLADEGKEELSGTTMRPRDINMNNVFAQRKDIHSLELACKIFDQKARVVRSEMLPTVAIVGAYHAMNPNTYNGFANKFGFAFSVGAMVKVPLWHWGGLTNKHKAALADARVKRMELDDVREKIQLQVSQAAYRYQEAYKTYELTCANLEKANENLRIAQVAFREGVSVADDVLKAQTAWLLASNEKLDAEIDVRLCDVYLSKVMGEMRF
ncbi:MAG: TolC family protein [Muribaculaceae bacterium]|nr:TolC family protein [Muribaculaceae bacterium]